MPFSWGYRHNATTASGGLRWDEQRCKSSFSGPTCTSALDDASKLPSNFFTFMGMFIFDFKLRKMMANPLLGIVIVHFLLHLMISSSLPSARTLRHPANFVYSLISNSLQFGVANKKSNLTMKSCLRSMLLMATLS